MAAGLCAANATFRHEFVQQAPGSPLLESWLTPLLCCASVQHPYHCREQGLDAGTVQGHEFVGHVVQAGEPADGASLLGWCCSGSMVGRNAANKAWLQQPTPPPFLALSGSPCAGPAVHKFKPGDRVMSPFTVNCGQCWFCQRGLTARRAPAFPLPSSLPANAQRAGCPSASSLLMHCSPGHAAHPRVAVALAKQTRGQLPCCCLASRRCERSQLFGWVEGGCGLHGAQAEYVRVPMADATLAPAPGDVSDEEALLLGVSRTSGQQRSSAGMGRGMHGTCIACLSSLRRACTDQAGKPFIASCARLVIAGHLLHGVFLCRQRRHCSHGSGGSGAPAGAAGSGGSGAASSTTSSRGARGGCGGLRPGWAVGHHW